MTLITFKNGLPLLLQPAPGSDIGLVAADSGCCCPPPPPERCWCGSFCSYFIELIEPAEIAFKTPSFICSAGQSAASSTFTGPWGPPPPGSFSSYALVGSARISDLDITTSSSLYWLQIGRDFASAELGMQVICNGINPQTQQPEFHVYITVELLVYIEQQGQAGVRRNYFSNTSNIFIIPGQCLVSTSRQCPINPLLQSPYPPGLQFMRLPTPLEITVNGNGTSSLGELPGQLSFTDPQQIPEQLTNALIEMMDYLMSVSNWTFRITASETCGGGCCCEENTPITEVETSEDCAVSLVGKPEELRDIDTITVVVEWDELIGECNSGNNFNFGQIEEEIDPTFACVQPGPFTIQADLRGMNLAGNLTASSSCNLWQFSGVLQLYFEGVGPFGGRAQSGINLNIFVSECHSGYVSPIPAPGTDPSWCPNDYAEPVVTLVIAP